LPTLRAKKIALSRTPTKTPIERSWVKTTVTTVANITRLSVIGITRSFWSDFQSKVPTETVIITATSAPMGIRATHLPSTTTKKSRKMPAARVESRLRPPERTLMTD
jgi:hypothetical protein